MKLLRSDFSRVHLAVMLFALANVVLGILLALAVIPYGSFAEIHSFTGAVLLPLILLAPMLFRKRKQVYAALKARFFITKRDLHAGKPLLLIAKAITLLLALGFIVQLITAGLLETGLAYSWFPGGTVMRFHMSLVYVIPALLVLHFTFMWLAYRRKPQPAHAAAPSEK